MSDLTHLFKVGQKVKIKFNDFEGLRFKDGVIKETYVDHIVVTEIETNTDMWFEHGMLDMIYSLYGN